MRWTMLETPIGVLSVAADDRGVCRVHFGPVELAITEKQRPPDFGPVEPATAERQRSLGADQPDSVELAATVTQLRAYFAGELAEFSVPLSVRRGGDFERAVWREISKIPYGETRTYGEVAAAVGDPGAARAVGVACNRNPVPVIVACHRIVGAGNKLVGFGGGLARKRYLLELEAGVLLQKTWG